MKLIIYEVARGGGIYHFGGGACEQNPSLLFLSGLEYKKNAIFEFQILKLEIERFTDLDKLNLVVSKVLGYNQIFFTAPVASKNGGCFKSGQK